MWFGYCSYNPSLDIERLREIGCTELDLPQWAGSGDNSDPNRLEVAPTATLHVGKLQAYMRIFTYDRVTWSDKMTIEAFEERLRNRRNFRRPCLAAAVRHGAHIHRNGYSRENFRKGSASCAWEITRAVSLSVG